jgi:hypothetical protein
MNQRSNQMKVKRKWIGQTRSRSLEMGTVLLISPDEGGGSQAVPAIDDQICLHVSGDKFPAQILNASGELLALDMMKGPTLFLEPVPIGHPAHGEHLAVGVPSSVWKVTSVQ